MPHHRIRHRYAPYWRQLSHHIRFERDGGVCRQCGVAHGAIDPRRGCRAYLTCAHLDRVESNNHPDNLLTLCSACHLDYDREDNRRRFRRNFWKRKGQLSLPLTA